MSRQYASHCDRKIVSKLWQHCPYCGASLKIDAIVVPPTCNHLASKGNVKGLRCVRPENHEGKHRYQSVVATTFVKLSRTKLAAIGAKYVEPKDDRPLFDF